MKLKDKKVNIYREKYVPNGNGYTTKVTEPVALNVWAYFRQLSGKEIFAAAAYRYDEEVLFTINYRADLTTACYVEYNGVKYSVTRIDTFEGYKQDITLYCKRMKTAGAYPPPFIVPALIADIAALSLP